jgi:transglutaminase-like putative cysteine protease
MAALSTTQPITKRRRARDRYAENVYFQDGLLLTAVLVALLYLILATSLDAAGYVPSMALLLPVTLGALALGFFMAYSRFDGFFALSHSMFTGLAWILYLMSGQVTEDQVAPFIANGIPETQAQAYFVLLRWLNWIDAAFNNVASNDNYVFIFEICFLTWWLTYLGVWSIFRYGYTWRAIIPAAIVLLVNTYYAPSSILGFLVVFCLVAMLIFVRTNLAEQQLRWREQRVYFSSDVTFDFLRNGLAYSVVVVALAWLVPGFGRSMEVRAVLAPINQRWEETTQRMNRLYQGINRQTRPVSSSFGRSLSLGGPRTVGTSPIFRVATMEGRYWRAVVYDAYTGRQWLSTDDDELKLDANEDAPIAGWSNRQLITQTVWLMAPSGGLIFAAPDIVRVDVPINAQVSETPALAANGDPGIEITSARARRPLEADDRYVVVSAKTMITQRDLRAAGTEYPESITSHYLQLPEDFSERVAADAQEVTAQGMTPYDKARMLETYLRSFEYNDDIEAPPPDRDPVEYFLYDIRTGYCDYYATSMSVMLRSLGIPARVASGYAEGEFDPESGLFFVSERDAHTWVEVFFPGYGWIEFEPTAGETQLNRPSGDEVNEESLFDESMIDPSSGPITGTTGVNDEFAGDEQFGLTEDRLTFDEAAQAITDTWWVWTIFTPILLIGGVWLIWRTRVNGPQAFDPDLPPVIYERLHRWAARLGLTASPSDTPYEQAGSLIEALPEGRGPIANITERYVRYRFSRRTRVQDSASILVENAELQQNWRLLQPLVLRRWLRKLIGMAAPTRQDDHFQLVPEARERAR